MDAIKELLKYCKHLEIDFPNKDPAYQSKIDLAISSLVTGNYEKSKQMFDAAIEIDSTFPSGWLGKTFAEIAWVDDENFNSLSIDEYLGRAIRSSDFVISQYKVVIAGCLAYRHSEIIKNNILLVEEALKTKKEAQKTEFLAGVTAGTGTILVGKNKSTTSNVLGGALIAGAATKAVQAHLHAQELEILAKSVYVAALYQTYLSIPIIHLCGTLIEQIEDVSLKNSLTVIIDSWKECMIYFYYKQRVQLIKALKKFDIEDASNVQQLLSNRYSILEIGEFSAFMKIIGLSEHRVFNLLSTLFTETLPQYFNDAESKKALEVANKKQNKGCIVGLVFFIIGIFVLQSDYVQKSGNGWLPDTFFVAGIVIYSYLFRRARTKEMKEFQKIYDRVINDISTTSIKKEDFNLNLIEKQNGVSNYLILLESQ